MPRVGSDLKSFLLEALSTRKYKNLFYLDGLKVTFRLCCPRKESHEYISENIQIFKDWDTRRKHKFDYSYSRQRLESALKRSVYLVLISSRKDTYDFRFSNSEEVAVKKVKQRKGSTPVDKDQTEGEIHASSPGSLSSASSPGSSPVKSSYNCSVDREITLPESTKETFADESDDLQNFLVEETGGTDTGLDAPLLDPLLSDALHDSILQDLFSNDLTNYETEKTTAPVVLLPTPMDCEPCDLQDINDSTAEPLKGKKISGKHTDVETSGCGVLKENMGLVKQDPNIAHSVLELFPHDVTGFQGTGSSTHNSNINIKTYLVNGRYLVTLRKPSVISS